MISLLLQLIHACQLIDCDQTKAIDPEGHLAILNIFATDRCLPTFTNHYNSSHLFDSLTLTSTNVASDARQQIYPLL
jgi:hypothetical protein